MIRGDFLEKIKFEMNIQGQVGVHKQKRRKRSFRQVKRLEEWVGDEAGETERSRSYAAL